MTINQLWFTRCPVPTATGLAYKLGWLHDEFASDGISIATLQDASPDVAKDHHTAHGLETLIREGGNVPAFWARSAGTPTRLVGLTWIDEHQAIVVRGDSDIAGPADLAGRRVALPVKNHVAAASFTRAMAIHGFKSALALGALGLDDVTWVEIDDWPRDGIAASGRGRLRGLWPGLTALDAGDVDAVYVKGSAAVEAATRIGARVAINLDRQTERHQRVNNGTPRPITVHQHLLDEHRDLVVRFVAQGLHAADWAAANLDGVRGVLQEETDSGPEGVVAAYGDGFHQALHPDVSDERLELFGIQQRFLLLHGFLERDFELADWVDATLLVDARRLLHERAALAA